MTFIIDPFRFGGGGFQPSDLASCIAWWDASDSANITLSGSEVTAWADKVGALSLAKGTNGPTVVQVGGVDMLSFSRASSQHMGVTSAVPDLASGNKSFVIVWRAGDNTQQSLFGKVGSGNPNYGMFTSVGANGSLYWQMRDTVLANTLVLEDTATDWTDDVVHVSAFTYEKSLADAYLMSDTLSQAGAVASDLAYSSVAISPSNPFYVGTWNGTNGFLDGEIGDLIVFDEDLTNGDLAQIQAWAEAKYSL